VGHPAAAVGSRSDASCSSNAHHRRYRGQLAPSHRGSHFCSPNFKWLCRPVLDSAGAELLPSCLLRPCNAQTPHEAVVRSVIQERRWAAARPDRRAQQACRRPLRAAKPRLPSPKLFPHHRPQNEPALDTPSGQELCTSPIHLQSRSRGVWRLQELTAARASTGVKTRSGNVAGVASVDAWLAQLDLSQYAPAFRAAGWVTPQPLLPYQPASARYRCQGGFTAAAARTDTSCRRVIFLRPVALACRRASTRRPMAAQL